MFSVYYLFYFTAFMCRPFSETTSVISGRLISQTGQLTSKYTPNIIPLSTGTNSTTNTTTAAIQRFYSHETCHLWRYSHFGYQGWARLVSESAVIIMIFIQLALIGNEIWSVGRKLWWKVLVIKQALRPGRVFLLK